jgi:phage gpG-like protein
MDNPDPAQVASLEDLAECLRQLHVRADKPSMRALEDRTKHANGFLPGTQLKRVRIGRTTLNEVLRGIKLPKKAFLLTLVEVLNVDLEADRRWEQAWDRLAVQHLDPAAEIEAEQLRRQLTEAKAQADRADKETEQLRQQLAAVEDLVRQQATTGAAAETRAQGRHLQAITARAFPVSLSFEEAIDGLTVTIPEIAVKIPPAITDKQEFFYAFAEVRPHPVFGRDGENLTVTVPVTRRELEQGAEIKVPAFRRAPLTLKIPPGTPVGRKFRIPGLGVRGPSNETGYLIITFHEVEDKVDAGRMRAKLCTKARGDAVTVNPVEGSLPRPGHESEGLTKRELSSIPPKRGHAMDQARTRARDLATGRVIRLIGNAGRIAQSIPDNSQKACALAAAAEAVAAVDPGRARQLIADAERIAQSIPDNSQKACALAAVAATMAATDPSEARFMGRAGPLLADAERIAQSITDAYLKVQTLSFIAKAIGPIRAYPLIADADRIAQSITDNNQKACALAKVAEAVPAPDPDPGHTRQLIADAERIAQSITDESQKACALAKVAKAAVASYPGQAERIAHSITDNNQKARVLGLIAKAVAATNPGRAGQLIADAERIAQSITDESEKAVIRSRIAEAVAVTDPDDAERIARSITDAHPKTLAVIGIAEAVAAVIEETQ